MFGRLTELELVLNSGYQYKNMAFYRFYKLASILQYFQVNIRQHEIEILQYAF